MRQHFFGDYSMKPDVLIVGAGPVGLFTAIEMKLHQPALQIKILDRNKEYSRHHILKLERESLSNSKTYETFDTVRKLHGFVPTSEIETTFLNSAKELGIEIETGIKVDNCQHLLNQFPTAHTFIGADGAHSVVRRQLFDDEKIVDENLQYIVEIKYKAQGSTSRLPAATYGPALGQVHHFISENVGKEKDGCTPVSLFVFVDEETYREIRNTPNAQLADLDPTTKRMKKLLNTIRPWLSLRKVALDEVMISDSEKINGVALSVYQSACFAKEIEGKRVYLVGDAAAAVPYYRALNAGLIAAAVTAREIATTVSPDLEMLNKTLAELAQNEIRRATRQNKRVNWGRGLNFFLAHASTITTGALLSSDYEQAMLNARVTRPNIIRRNPRALITFNLFIITTVALFAVALFPLSIAMGPAILLSLIGASALVGTCVFLFKLTLHIMKKIQERDSPIRSLPAFPWETEDKEDNSLTLLSKLSTYPSEDNPSSAHDKDVINYSNPLKSSDNEPDELVANFSSPTL